MTVAKYCAELETSCEEAHRHLFDHNHLSKGRLKERYYRFNVEYGGVGIGLDEWKKLDTISSRTKAFLDEPPEMRKLKDCVELLCSCDKLAANIG